MASNKKLDVNDLPSPHELLAVNDLPSPAELQGQSSPQSNEPGAIVSGLAGVGQGLTAGFGDELYGALHNPVGAAQAAANLVGAGVKSKDIEEYQAQRDQARKFMEAAEAAHPYTTTGGKIIGSLIPAGAIAKGVGALGMIPELAEGAGLGAKMLAGGAEGALGGAGYGAVQGAGESSSNDNIGHDIGQGLMLGGATGGVLGAALPAAGEALSGTHNFLKENIGAYNDISDILAKEAGGTKILGDKAQTANYNKLVSEGEPIVQELQGLGGKFGAKQAEAAKSLPELNLAPEAAEMEQGLKSKFGITKNIPAEDNTPEIANKLNEINSKINDVNETISPRLSEKTAQLQAKKNQLDMLRQAKNDAMAKAMLSEDEASLSHFTSVAKNANQVAKDVQAAEQEVAKIQEIHSNKMSSLLDKKSELESQLQEAQKVASQPPTQETIYNPEFAGDVNKLQGRIQFLAQKYGGLENLPPEAQLEIRQMLKAVSPLEGGLQQPVQEYSENLRKALETKMKEASPEYAQSMANTSQALTARDLALKSPEKEFGAEGIKSADEYAKRVFKAAKGEGGISSDIIARQNAEAQKLLQGVGETDLAQKMQALQQGPARDYELSTITNKGNVYNPLTIAKKGAALAGRGAKSVQDFTVLNQNISDRLSDPLFVKSLANQMENAPIPQAAKNIFRQLSDTQDVGKQKAVQNVIMNTPALRGILQKMVGSENGSEK